MCFGSTDEHHDGTNTNKKHNGNKARDSRRQQQHAVNVPVRFRERNRASKTLVVALEPAVGGAAVVRARGCHSSR